MTIPILPYHADREGLDRWFSPRRADLMARVWGAGRRGATVAEIMWSLDRDGDCVALNTISTTLLRLERSGMVTRDRPAERGCHAPTRWRATFTESDFIEAQLAALYASLDIIGADVPRQ